MNFTRALEAENLIDELYASVLEPLCHEKLQALWADHRSGAHAGTDAREGLEQHFMRAFAIMERLDRSSRATPAPEDHINTHPRAAMLLTSRGRIEAANEPAQREFGIGPGMSLSQLHFEASGLAHMREALARLEQAPFNQLLTISRVLRLTDGSAPVLMLTRAQRPNGRPAMGLLAIADIGWTERIDQNFSKVFGLTKAECDVARAIVAGQTSECIALARGRSPATVRTQIKSVLRKLDIRTQTELVRLVASLTQGGLRSE